MLTTIIIPTHNPKIHFLKQTLDSIRRQTCKNYEVIIVENPNSTEDVLSLAVQYGAKHTTCESGANRARNKGAELASGDILLFLDDDIIASDSLVEKYQASHSLYPAGAIGGPVNLRYIDGKPNWINKHFEGYLARLDHGNPLGFMPFEVKKEWDLHVPLVSANLSFRKSTFNKLGGFDEGEGYNKRVLLAPNDELGILTRCERKNPGMIYVPDAYVTHLIPKERATSDYICRRMYGQGVADFRSTSILNPNLSKIEIYEKFLLDYGLLMINDPSSYYTLFKGMKRVDRLFGTMVYHKGRLEYSRGVLSQIEL